LLSRPGFRRLAWGLAGIAILAAIWLIAGYLLAINPTTKSFTTFGLIPTMEAFPEMWGAGKIQAASMASGYRLGAGLGIAIAIGVPIGVLMGRIKWFRDFSNSPFQFLRMISPLAWTPLAVLVFVFAPKTPTTLLVFAAVIGFTYLSTVPPTAGLVARFFGPAHMATLFGVVMLSHQVGGFLGAWLGGKAFEATGSYDWMWWIDIVLAVGAALVHLPIDERPARAAAQAA
jgi:ABC-type nitrate/sulfonate/bicarbonate transport system permease component